MVGVLEACAGTGALTNHNCLLLDEEQVPDIVDRYEIDIPGTLTEENLHLHVPMSAFVAAGSKSRLPSIPPAIRLSTCDNQLVRRREENAF